MPGAATSILERGAFAPWTFGSRLKDWVLETRQNVIGIMPLESATILELEINRKER